MNDNNLPKELEKIIGKEYIFQLRLDKYNLKYGRENYTVSRIFDYDISEKNNTLNEVEIKKVTVQYIYLIMNSLVFKRHNEFVTLTHINMYLGFFFFFFFGEKVYIGFLTLMILILIYCFLCRHIQGD